MMAVKSKKKKRKRKINWSHILALLVILSGLLIAQESLFLMFYCIRNDYTSTAAWLTAAVTLAEAIIIGGLTAYTSLAKTDHKEGGITFEAAKANGFKLPDEDSENSPLI